MTGHPDVLARELAAAIYILGAAGVVMRLCPLSPHPPSAKRETPPVIRRGGPWRVVGQYVGDAGEAVLIIARELEGNVS